MARLSCVPTQHVSSASFLESSFSTSFTLRHLRNPRISRNSRPSTQGNQHQQQQPWVRCCEKPPPSSTPPLQKKRVKIPSKRSKSSDRPWWNVIFRTEEGGSTVRPSSGGSTSTKPKGVVSPMPESQVPSPDDVISATVAEKGQQQHPGKTAGKGQAPPPPVVKFPPTPGKKAAGEGGRGRPAPVVKVPVTTSQAPLLEAVKICAAQNTASFHFPGHHRGVAAPPALVDAIGRKVFAHDLPELPELDNLFDPVTVIAEAQKKAALAFGADATFFLVNGTTCGIQAAVMATCKPGETLILPRNCHLSAVSAMVLSGTQPWYVIPDYDSNWGISHGVSRDSIADAVSQSRALGGKVGAVLIVSPTYYGVCSPIDEIAKLCREMEVPLIVDEAHGAHFRFHEELPGSALEQGADIAVQSTHKVLGSLTQSSMLHVRKGGRVDRDLLLRCLRMVQSSSPSYLLLSSLDAARAQISIAIDDDNAVFSSALLEPAIDLSTVARERLSEIPNIVVMDEETIGVGGEVVPDLDPLRITVGLWRLNIDGYEADDVLRKKFGVVAELPAMHSLTFAFNSGTTAPDVARLVEAWRTLSLWYSKEDNYISMEEARNPLRGDEELIKPLLELPSSSALSPRDAFFSKTVKVDAEEAVGQISAELMCPYPPGIPVITPGEIISETALAYLRSILKKGGTISGPSDPGLNSMFVCER